MNREPEHNLEISGLLAGDGTSAPSGPAVLDVYAPGGIFEPNYLPDASRKEQRDYTSVVDENKVICYDCQHCWIMWKYAPVQNVKPDGSPIKQREGYCLLPAGLPGGAPLPLDERYILTCNRFHRAVNAIDARKVAMGEA